MQSEAELRVQIAERETNAFRVFVVSWKRTCAGQSENFEPDSAQANGSYSWGVHEIGARSAQEFFHFLNSFANPIRKADIGGFRLV